MRVWSGSAWRWRSQPSTSAARAPSRRAMLGTGAIVKGGAGAGTIDRPASGQRGRVAFEARGAQVPQPRFQQLGLAEYTMQEQDRW